MEVGTQSFQLIDMAAQTERTGEHAITSKTVKRQDIEGRVLSGLKNRLLEPKALSLFMDEYIALLKKAENDNEFEQKGFKQELRKTEKNIDAIIHAIEQGDNYKHYAKSVTRTRSQKRRIKN